jgi:RNA polymerase sigma factor (sigma-70 family)
MPMDEQVKTPNGERSDEALILAHKSGDEGALHILFTRYFGAIYHYLLNHSPIVKDTSFLEDISQEIFLKVFSIIKQGGFEPRGEGSFRAWIYTIAENVCRNCNYHRIRQPIDIYGVALDFIPDKPVIPPEEESERQSEIAKLAKKIISKMTDKEQKLMMYFGDDKSYKKILKDPAFRTWKNHKNPLAFLKKKIYNTRQKLIRELKK